MRTYNVSIGDYTTSIRSGLAPFWGAMGLRLFDLSDRRGDVAAWALKGPIDAMVARPQAYDGSDAGRESYSTALGFLIYLRAACERNSDQLVKVTLG